MAVTAKCLKCDLYVDENNQKVLRCIICDELWHIACATLNAKSYEVITKNMDIHWFYYLCNRNTIIEELKEFRDIRAQHIQLTNDIYFLLNRFQVEYKLSNQIVSQPVHNQAVNTIDDVSNIIRDENEILFSDYHTRMIEGAPLSNYALIN